ncbi:MAG: HEAT repeat domain-containing protein [Planctomycetes bacterium]|nr:HEAT repeat domain-containing protein [Planctomycetota bacterium]
MRSFRRRTVPLALASLAALLGAGPVAARSDDPPVPQPGGDPPPPGADQLPPAPDPADAAAAEKRKRIDLDRRRDELPAASKPAMAIVDRFREKDFRVWGTLRNEVVAQGANALPALFIAIQETDWETRAFAASCLGDLKDKAGAAALCDAYAGEKYGEARRQIMLALALIEAPTSQGTFVTALADDEVGVRLAALHGLSLIATPAMADVIAKFVADADLDIRYAARGALAALGDEATIVALVAEANALVEEKRASTVDSPVIEDNGDRYSQYLLGIALSRTEDKRADRILTLALGASEPFAKKDFLRMGAAVGLGIRAGRTGVIHQQLLTGINDKDGHVRVACSYGLGFVKSPEVVPRLVRALSDSQMDVRYNVVTALGRIGDEESSNGLRKALGDRADEVRVGAVRALGQVRNATATKALLQAVRDDKYMIRVLAARQLAYRTTEEGVLEAIVRASDDADYGVREAAIAALAHHPDGAAVHAKLAAGLDDPDHGVQANACLALAKIAPNTPAVSADDASARKAVAFYLRGTHRKLTRAAEEFIDAARPPAAVLPLIDGLASDTADARRRANTLLLRISEGSGMGFDPEGPKIDRDAAIRRWREWWSGSKKLPPRGARARAAITGSLADAAKDLKWKGLDIALLFDSTGSMSGLLNAAKERIDELIGELNELLPSVRVSVYTYRDKGDNYLFYGTPLTFDTWKLQGFLQYADAGQGGDLPEAVYDTVKNCAEKLQWRSYSHKVIVYAGDATHHREQDAQFMSFIKGWFTKESEAALHALYTDSKRRSLDIKARKKRDESDAARYPVFETYQRTAEAGRGKAVMLDDESALIKELLVLTFGDEWRADVENLMDFER